jgi:hypothetical protein
MRGTLEGHSGWVTSLATSLEKLVLTANLLKTSQANAFIAPICCYLAAVTKPSSSGILLGMSKITGIPNEVYTAIRTSSRTA